MTVKPSPSFCSNNTNKLSPQELWFSCSVALPRSNNTNKLSPQEPFAIPMNSYLGSNNTLNFAEFV